MQLSAVAVGLREMRSTEIKLRTEENSTSGSRDLNKKKRTSRVTLPWPNTPKHPYNHALVCTCKTLLHCTNLRKGKILLHENIKTISSLFPIKIYFSLPLFCFALVQKILMKEFSHPKVMFQIVLS